jgi:hypothetical protein
MRLETKFMRLRTPVTIGSWFGDWQVTWLGGWTRDRLSYLVMAVRVPMQNEQPQTPDREARTDAHRRKRPDSGLAGVEEVLVRRDRSGPRNGVRK